MSLRNKILSLLTLFPLVGLLGYFVFGTNFYIQDKRSYILDSNLQLVVTMAQFLNSEWHDLNNNTDLTAEKLATTETKKILLKNSLNRFYLVNSEGNVLLSSENANTPDLRALLDGQSLERVLNQNLVEASFEGASPNNTSQYISFASVPGRPLLLLIMMDKSAVHRASILFLIKTFAILVLITALAFVVSYFLTNSLTARLRILVETMETFGQGKMTAEMRDTAKDEVGRAAGVFNKMALDIRNLITEKEESVRKDVELSTARDVQKQFLPAHYFSNERLDITGFYESANECGGDWWYYFAHDDKLLACIGDVTGHGLSSALLTAAARSAIAVIQDGQHEPSEMMRKLNLAIYETSRGALQMTFLILQLDLKTKKIIYSSASHEAAILLPGWSSQQEPTRVLKKSDFQYLADVHGRRLGEASDSTYGQSTAEFNFGDTLFMYTDGLPDCRNKLGKSLGERGLLNAIIKTKQVRRAKDLLDVVSDEVAKHRKDEPLPDDVSYLVVHLKS